MNSSNFDNYSETFFDILHKDQDFDKLANGFSTYYYDCLPDDKASPILDVGCGAGQFLRFLEFNGYFKVEGIEVSKQQAERARTKVKSTIHEGDVTDYLKNKNSKYKLITINDVLEHIPKNEIIPLLQTLKTGLSDNRRSATSRRQRRLHYCTR